MWVVKLHVKDSNKAHVEDEEVVYTRDEIMSILHDIESKDKTFVVKVEDGKVYVSSTSKNNAFRRGMWCFHKLGLNFEVEWKHDSNKK